MTLPVELAAPELSFAVRGAAPERYAASPSLRLELAIGSGDTRPVHALLLDMQVRIAARRRRYDGGEEERLTELFGPVEGWKSSLSSLLWTNATVYVPPFEGHTTVAVPVACTYDFEVAAAKYLDALRGGAVPLELLFSGTLFYEGEGGAHRMARLPLDREARFDLPVAVWREAIDACFPGSAWLRLRRDTFERLADHRARNALPTWEATIDSLLGAGGARGAEEDR
jgi:hypothetical protein